MASRNIEFNWMLVEEKCTVLQKVHGPGVPAETSPAIYRREDGDKRCTVNMIIQHGMHAMILSSAKSCEIYSIDEHGRQEYQGFCRGMLDADKRWRLRVAPKVSTPDYAALSRPSCCEVQLPARSVSLKATVIISELGGAI